MTDTLTPAKGLTQQTVGGNRNTWGGILNTTIGLIDSALGGTLNKSIAGNTTLSSTEIQNSGFKFTGALSSNATIAFPGFYGLTVILNATSGGFSLVCGNSGNTVTVRNGENVAIWSDGTDFIRLAATGGGATVPNAGLTNSSITIAGHSVSLGGTQALAASDLTNGTTGSGNVVLSSGPTISMTATGGSTAATLAARFGHILNVVDDFGANPNGAVDTSAALIAAVSAISSTGGTLFYPPGTYLVGTTIPDVANVYHVGAGPLATIVRANADIPVFTRSGSDTVTINGGGIVDMSIHGFWNQNPAQHTNSIGIRCYGANRAIYRNLRFFSCYIGMEAAFNWQTLWDNLSVDGQGSDQSWRGFQQDDTTSSGSTTRLSPSAASRRAVMTVVSS